MKGLYLPLCALLLAASPTLSQTSSNIAFAPGATSTTINGTIRGHEYIDYVLSARGGQTMVVSLAVTGTNGHGSAYFNILPAGQDYGGPYVGSTDDDSRAEVTIPSDGDWAIRVYLMGNDRDADKTVGYSIDVYIEPSRAAAKSHPAPRARPSADRALVSGLTANDLLNVRSGPGTDFRVVGALSNGTQVLLHECRMQGNSRWCEIEMLTDMHERGWVNARYLTDQRTAPARPASAPHVQRVRFPAGATGTEIPTELSANSSITYVLGARDGQELLFRLDAPSPEVRYRIFNPDGSVLLDEMRSSQHYRGQLWQSGDHRIEIRNHTNRPQAVRAAVSIR